MKLSDHFLLSEFTRSQTATRHNLPNSPDTTQIANLRQLCQTVLEPVRERLSNKPLYISSGFRSLELNRRIGSKDTSQHVAGCAADFTCPEFGDPDEVAYMLGCSDVPFDQLILEFGKLGWIHISYSESPRRQILTASYSDDGVRYTPGLA